MESKKIWWVVDNRISKRSFADEEPIGSVAREEAIKTAQRKWDSLSEHDKRDCDEFYVCVAGRTEDGSMDYETISELHRLK